MRILKRKKQGYGVSVERKKATLTAEKSNRFAPHESRLISLRHHSTLWLVPVALLVVALLPWPYGFYNFLRLGICVVSLGLTYAQWKHDDAVSGWVVAFGAIALLYNPLLPVYLTREIWSVLNIVTAGLFIWHFWIIRQMVRASRTLKLQNSRSGTD